MFDDDEKERLLFLASPMGDPAGSVLDTIRFHSLGAILDWLAGWLVLPRSHEFSFSRPGTDRTGIYFVTLVHRYNIDEFVFFTSFFIVFPRGVLPYISYIGMCRPIG